jgi:hypothetical protein
MFHPLRVLPAFMVWIWMQRDLLARFVAVKITWRAPALAAEARRGS